MLYNNAEVRDEVVKLATEHNVFPDELETKGIVDFIVDDDNVITGFIVLRGVGIKKV